MDFSSILKSHGYTRDSYDFESTIIAFDYEVHAALFDSMTVFDVYRSKIYRQFDTPNAFLRVDLVRKRYCIDRAIKFFLRRWKEELRYINPVCEIIEIYESPKSASIHVLTIAEDNAVTLLFNIT